MPDSLEEPQGHAQQGTGKRGCGRLAACNTIQPVSKGEGPYSTCPWHQVLGNGEAATGTKSETRTQSGPNDDCRRWVPSLADSSAAPESGAASGDASRELPAAAAGCRGATAPAGCASALGLSVSLSAPLSFFAVSSFSTLI